MKFKYFYFVAVTFVCLSFFLFLKPVFAFESGSEFAISGSIVCDSLGVNQLYYTDGDQYSLLLNSNVGEWVFSDGAEVDIFGDSCVDGVSYYFVINYASSTYEAFINAVSFGSGVTDPPADDVNFDISTNIGVSDLIEYDYALTNDEILDLMDGTETTTAPAVLDTIMTIVVNTTMEFVVIVFTKFWGYVLVVSIISGLCFLLMRFVVSVAFKSKK